MATSLTYPTDLSFKYYLSIQFQKYSRPDPFSSLTNLSPVDYGTSTGLGGVINLPLPSNLKNSLDLNWLPTSIGTAGELVAAAADAANPSSPNHDTSGAAAIAAGNLMAFQAAPSIAGLAAAAATAYAKVPTMAGTAQNIAEAGTMVAAKALLQTAGLAMNPVLTQMFNSPEFKQHVFSWKFAPDNATESQTLKSIIKTIDFNAKPSAEKGGAYFGYPSMATITIHNGANVLYKIQTSVVTDFTVNYAPNGVPAFFGQTNEPVMVQLDITFLEIILNTRNNSVDDISGLGLEINPIQFAPIDAIGGIESGVISFFNNSPILAPLTNQIKHWV